MLSTVRRSFGTRQRTIASFSQRSGVRVWDWLREQPIKFRVASLNKFTVSSSSLPPQPQSPSLAATKGKTMAEVKLDAKVFHRRAKGLLSFWKVSSPYPSDSLLAGEQVARHSPLLLGTIDRIVLTWQFRRIKMTLRFFLE